MKQKEDKCKNCGIVACESCSKIYSRIDQELKKKERRRFTDEVDNIPEEEQRDMK